MRPKGMWTAGRLRTVIEAYLPNFVLSLSLYSWHSGNLVTFGWFLIVSMGVFLWGAVWPAYRLRKAPGSWRQRIWFWLVFLFAYIGVSIGVELLFEWIFGIPPIMMENPEFFEEEPYYGPIATVAVYLVVYAIWVISILGARLFFWLMALFYEWVSQRLVRQFTVSHVGMLVLVFWISAVFAFLYMAGWNLPNKVEGVEEVEAVAHWTAPLIEDQNPSQLESWLQHVRKKTFGGDWYVDEDDSFVEWRVYDKRGRLLEATQPGSAGSLREERALVKRVLSSFSADSLLADPDTNRYLAAAPIFNDQYEVVGAVVMERQVSQEVRLGILILYFIFFLLLSFGGTFLALILALAIAAVFGYMRARSLTRRFQKVAHAAEEWSKGELSYRIAIDQPDELGTLSGQLNQVAASLQEANAKLAAEKKHVEALLHFRKEWVSNASHELRTPVAIIRGHLESWNAGDHPQKAAKRLTIMNREITRLQKMIDELFMLATQDEIEVEEKRHPLEPVDVGNLLKEIHEDFAPIAWRERKIGVELVIDADDVRIQANEVRLRQILHNLVRNALRHTPEGGMILLSTAIEEDSVYIDVVDTGSGIPAAELPHVFERHYRGRVADDRYQGSGIGLALVKEWITQMGGKVEIESEEGKGTKVRLRFSI